MHDPTHRLHQPGRHSSVTPRASATWLLRTMLFTALGCATAQSPSVSAPSSSVDSKQAVAGDASENTPQAGAKASGASGATPSATKPAPGATAPAAESAPSKPRLDQVFVAGGTFWMGCDPSRDSLCDADERGREVDVKPFEIDRLEVSVGQYRACVDAGACSARSVAVPYWNGGERPEAKKTCTYTRGEPDLPMSCVSFTDARKYCRWMGLDLPTEERWEKAARGTDRRLFPWGNEPIAKNANLADESFKAEFPSLAAERGVSDGYAAAAPVGRFEGDTSPYGMRDAAGNLQEWTRSEYDDGRRVTKGGSWQGRLKYARASNRNGSAPDHRFGDLGFRCASR